MDIEDRLYGLPLAEFTRARDEAARESRKAGEREAADRIKALRKPTVAAAAVNRLVRENRDEVERFLGAAAELRDAQFSGKGELAAASRQEREALEQLTRVGGEAVRQSLLAAAVDDDAARELLEARLVRELEPRGFGTLLAYAPSSAPALKQVSARELARPEGAARPGLKPALPDEGRAKEKADDSAARARLQRAKAALSAAEAEELLARRHWRQTQTDLQKAQAAVDRARRDLAERTP